MKIVMKFGGKSINTPQKILRAARIVADRVKSNDNVIVVVSAFAGVTDSLILAAHQSTKDLDSAREIINNIYLKHLGVLDKISNQTLRCSLKNMIKSSIFELSNTLAKLAGMMNVSADILDSVMSFGERLSAPIFSTYLAELGINSKPLNGWEAGIITDENHGNAHPLPDANKLIKDRLEPIINSGVVPVVTGFIGSSLNGKITTLGRGGSDYTASLIASSLMVDELWLWTDVDGLMTADPKIVPKAKLIKYLSYIEAIEFCLFGAKKLHYKTFEPIMNLGIPIRIKNILNPNSEGTVIVKNKLSSSVKAVCILKGSATITIRNSSFPHDINIYLPDMMFLPSSNITVLTEKGGSVKHNDISMIATVGINLLQRPELAYQVLKSLKDQGINVQAMFSVGNSAILAINDGFEEQAANLIHNAVIGDK